jgi:hypothetical protein
VEIGHGCAEADGVVVEDGADGGVADVGAASDFAFAETGVCEGRA